MAKYTAGPEKPRENNTASDLNALKINAGNPEIRETAQDPLKSARLAIEKIENDKRLTDAEKLRIAQAALKPLENFNAQMRTSDASEDEKIDALKTEARLNIEESRLLERTMLHNQTHAQQEQLATKIG